MNTPFTYEVKRVDHELKVMEVEFKADGFSTMLIGMLIPKEGVDLQEYIASHAPHHQWAESKKILQNIQVGFSGTVIPTPPTEPTEVVGPNASEIVGRVSVDDALLEAAIQRVLQEQKDSTV